MNASSLRLGLRVACPFLALYNMASALPTLAASDQKTTKNTVSVRSKNDLGVNLIND